MRLAHAFLFGVLASSSVACLRRTEFQCTTSADCGPGGTCQISGHCSVTDSACASNQRYSDSAGENAGQCVDNGGVVDALPPSDAADSDAPPLDDAPGACPGYNAITGGQAGHVYQLVTTTRNWPNQRDFCTSTSASAYLAIPDDQDELEAMVDLATSTRFWVGISDQATEGQWRNVLGDTQTFLPWRPGNPSVTINNIDDCVYGRNSNPATIGDDRCMSTQLPAICECVP